MPSRRIVLPPLALLTLAVTIAPLATAESPEKIYGTSCAPCHGKNGKPTRVFTRQGVRDFTDPVWQKETSDETIEQIIRDGKKGTMMAGYANRLSSEETKALVAFIRKLGPEE